MKINLRAAFLGLKFLPPPITLGFNNLNPKLILEESEIIYRNLFLTHKLAYSDIESVNTFTAYITNNIIIKPKKSLFVHSFNVKNKEEFITVLQFLANKNCPLTDKALKAMLS